LTTPWIVAFLALSSVVVAEALLLIGFLRRALAVLEAAESRLSGSGTQIGGATPGMSVPAFEVRNSHGQRVRSDELTNAPTLFLFLSAHCEPCRPLLAQLRASGWDQSEPRLVAVLGESVADRALEFPAGVRAVYQSDRAAAHAFESTATPQAFAVDASGVVTASTIPESIDDLRRLTQSLEGGDGRAPSQRVERAHA
jgi:hypothetical protein